MNNKTQITLFSKLLRDLEVEVGTRDLSEVVLKALELSIDSFKSESVEDFCEQFSVLKDILAQTEPKFGILNYHFANLTLSLKKDLGTQKCPHKHWRHCAVKKVKKILKNARKFKRRLLENAEKLDVERKTILIHDHSRTVQDVLINYKKAGFYFDVVIAEQDFVKSHNNIDRMHAAKIPFRVVPSYMLSHIHNEIDMLFFGALTLKDTMDFVMDPGTHGIISEFHLEKIPSYMFINTMKFSLWKSQKKGEVFMRQHRYKHHSKPIEYNKIKYSHDRVPAKLFKRIVTNEGVFTAKGVEKLFAQKYDKYKIHCAGSTN